MEMTVGFLRQGQPDQSDTGTGPDPVWSYSLGEGDFFNYLKYFTELYD